jgi:hypothetical protein
VVGRSQPHERGRRAGATDVERVVLFGVEVEEKPTLQRLPLQADGAAHPRLLVRREEDLERAVLDRRIDGRRQRQRHAEAVVRAERRVVRANDEMAVAAVEQQADRVVVEVVRAAGSLHANHVDVGLEDKDRRLLAPLRRGDLHDEIAGVVAANLEPLRRRHGAQVVADVLLLVDSRGTCDRPAKISQTRAGLREARTFPSRGTGVAMEARSIMAVVAFAGAKARDRGRSSGGRGGRGKGRKGRRPRMDTGEPEWPSARALKEG